MEIINFIINSITTFGSDHHLVLMALLGGVFPSLIWFAFWLREDECEEVPVPEKNMTYLCEPEPKSLLLLTFVLGGLMVPLALIAESIVHPIFSGLSLVIAWAAIEELLKFAVYQSVDAKTDKINEPADPLVYLSITALGFSAIENTLFLYQAMSGNASLSHIIIGQDYRFLGASILHVLSSGFIGICLGYTFFHSKLSREVALVIGLIGAIALHSYFNYLIIIESGNSLHTSLIIWGVGIIFLALIEGLRYLAKKQINNI